MIEAVARKEVAQRRALLTIAFLLVCGIAASMPFWFGFSLHQARLHPADETAALVLTNLKSYRVFVESTWLARGLGRTMMLLALIAGAGAIAGEREARTLPMLAQSSMSLGAIALVKFAAIAVWLFLVAFASAGLLSVDSLLTAREVPALGIVVGSFVAWLNAIAFLSIVFFASAVSSRTVVAGALGLGLGIAVSAIFAGFGVNVTALGAAMTGADGALDGGAVARAIALALGIATIAGAGTLAALDLRRR